MSGIWLRDEFENIIDATLIAMYEDKVRTLNGSPSKVKPVDFSYFKKKGAYIPDSSRVFEFAGLPENPRVIAHGVFDMRNDLPPKGGIMSMYNPDWHKSPAPGGNIKAETYLMGVKRTDKMRKGWVKTVDGKLYELCRMVYSNKGLRGDKSYFTLTKSGEVHACDCVLQSYTRHEFGHDIASISKHEPWLMTQTAMWGALVLQEEADRRFCWTIKAEESGQHVTLGCIDEQVKSLLYARSLPVTETGRKRPILHLVESHKRRVRNGTDIDVSGFLRGVQKVQIGDTTFTVKPPKVKYTEVTENSRRYY